MTTREETHDVLRRYADSWLAGDIDALLAAYADDVVFHYFGSSDVASAHVGKQAAVDARSSRRTPGNLRATPSGTS